VFVDFALSEIGFSASSTCDVWHSKVIKTNLDLITYLQTYMPAFTYPIRARNYGVNMISYVTGVSGSNLEQALCR
jgi:hypothetical protein